MNDIIPKFLRIKLPRKRYNPTEEHQIYKTLLKQEINNQHKTRTITHTKIKFLHHHLLQHLHYMEYETIYNDLQEEIKSNNQELDHKRWKKLDHLINNKNKAPQKHKKHPQEKPRYQQTPPTSPRTTHINIDSKSPSSNHRSSTQDTDNAQPQNTDSYPL
ncbi:hypothetical protein PPYR_00054 [Photinus pyralis]|uniref:Uncharacterized protein n=1 Tax=Photinus pyralis TaxID=7054 RepID=A0A5N4B0H5_PHOPY|nr:hypothetical protein PPYR_00054 [Photinus pyralis]